MILLLLVGTLILLRQRGILDGQQVGAPEADVTAGCGEVLGSLDALGLVGGLVVDPDRHGRGVDRGGRVAGFQPLLSIAARIRTTTRTGNLAIRCGISWSSVLAPSLKRMAG